MAKPNLKGRFFCLTGKMWTTREAIQIMVRSSGAHVVNTPRNDNIVLVVADLGRQASQSTAKYQAAKKRGCKIMSSESLQKVLNGTITIETALKEKAVVAKPVTPARPIDRAKHQQKVAKVLADLDSFTK